VNYDMVPDIIDAADSDDLEWYGGGGWPDADDDIADDDLAEFAYVLQDALADQYADADPEDVEYALDRAEWERRRQAGRAGPGTAGETRS